MPVCRVHMSEYRYFVVSAPTAEQAVLDARALFVDRGFEDREPVRTEHLGESHETVGRLFRSPLCVDGMYLCTSYDSMCGFWMQNPTDPADRRNVSERAIGRTFHRVQKLVSDS